MSSHLADQKTRFVQFKNVKSEYKEWRAKTMAIANSKGCDHVLKKLPEGLLTSKEVQKEGVTEAEKKLYQANADAYNILVMSTTGVSFGSVDHAKDAFTAMTKLDMKWAPVDSNSLTQLQKDFTNCTLKNTKKDPDEWFIELYDFNQRFIAIKPEYEKKEHELKAHVLGNLPEEYTEVITLLEGSDKNWDEYQDVILTF
jgi:hypothetical protein